MSTSTGPGSLEGVIHDLQLLADDLQMQLEDESKRHLSSWFCRRHHDTLFETLKVLHKNIASLHLIKDRQDAK